MADLKGKVAVITGAAKGIGAAVAKRLYDDGAAIALLDMDEKSLTQVFEQLGGNNNIAFYSCNVADKANVDDVFLQIKERFGAVSILVNNAGITKDAMFHKMSEEAWEMVMDVNLKGVFNCCQAVVGDMREERYGKIVNLASVSAFGNIGQTNYGASKAAVIGFTKCLAKEVARYDITVNAVAPSYVDTEMMRAVPDKVMEKFLSAIPMNRLARPSEIAAVVAFLCCDDSSFVTGECIVASGGSYM